nr:hypothetical protein [Nitrosopumilaceae archaeon]NIU86129.1 hypothetical protein [Nitrosopumilaceae archaeon]NIV64934.1 hypothetical protein [Nitrosopumilaceae archaeon]NIX60396.1 hypothetical protein [Nitrosopumilaceae archaeon]
PYVLGYYLDEGKGASTRGDGRQQIERTAIELRYKIMDKVDINYLESAKEYDIQHVYNFGKKIPVRNLIR